MRHGRRLAAGGECSLEPHTGAPPVGTRVVRKL
jgi:hypothetical protein